MKKWIALFVALTMLFAFAGCADTKDNNKTPGNPTKDPSEMTIGDIVAAVDQFSEGLEFNAEVSLKVHERILDMAIAGAEAEGVDFSALLDSYKSGSSYIFPVTASGTYVGQSGRISLLFGSGQEALPVTEIIMIGTSQIFFNAEAFYTFIMDLLKLVGMPEGIMPDWPSENQYIEIISAMEYMQDLFSNADGSEDILGDLFEGELDDIIGSDADLSAIMGMLMSSGVLEAVEEILSGPDMQNLLALYESGLKKAEIISLKDGFYTITINNDNLPAALKAIRDSSKTGLAPILANLMQEIAKLDVLPEEMKTTLALYGDKDVLQSHIDMLFAELTDEVLDEMTAQMGDTDIEISYGIKLGDKSISVKESVKISESGAAMEVESAFTMNAITSTEISAPSNVLSNEELMALISIFEGAEAEEA